MAIHVRKIKQAVHQLRKEEEFPTIPLAEVREHQKPYLEMLTQLKNVTIINGLDPFCPDGICRMFSEDGIPYYLDDNHISYDAGGRRLVDKALAPYLDTIAGRP